MAQYAQVNLSVLSQQSFVNPFRGVRRIQIKFLFASTLQAKSAAPAAGIGVGPFSLQPRKELQLLRRAGLGDHDGEAKPEPTTTDANAGDEATTASAKSDTEAAEAGSEPSGGVQPTLFQADEAEGQATEPPRPDELTREEAMAAFRQACRGRGTMTREELLKATAERLGYQRLGKRIRETLKNHLRAAIRRRIVARDGPDYVYPDTRVMGNYSQDELVNTIRAVTRPGVSYEREELFAAVAHYLGFQRVTRAVKRPLKSAINGAIRRDILTYEGNTVWREG
jgi:hypothetical protein